jgi:hypothetical protein
MIEKTINLVYESWNGDEYIINGESSSNEFKFFDPIGLFHSHILNNEGREDYSQRKMSIKICNLDDVKKKPHEKFFCVVSSAFLTPKIIVENNLNFFVLDSTLKMIKECDNLYLVITMEHEPVSDIDIQYAKNLCLEKGIPLHKFYYVNNNSLSDYLCQKYGVNVKKINFIDYSSTHALLEVKDVNFVTNKVGKFFMSRNKTAKPHRLNLLFHLMMTDINDDINYSKLFTYPEEDIVPYFLSLDNTEISEKIKSIALFNQIIKEDDYEKGKGYYDHKTCSFRTYHENSGSELHYPELKESYENSYINIVTESLFETHDFSLNAVHITEKSFRPFFYYQIQLILSTPNHIKKLKEKYDFDFFDDLINHSYDSELDDRKRFFMIIEEIKKINDRKEEIRIFYRNNQERFELNKKKLLDIALDKTEDFNLFWDLI